MLVANARQGVEQNVGKKSVTTKDNDQAGRGQRDPAYVDAYEQFDIRAAMSFLGDAGRGVNAAVLCCDRYCGKNRTALYWRGKDGRRTQYTFEELRDLSARFAQVLRDHGIGPGDRVAGLLPRVPELLITILATWRLGAVYQPLFTAFGPKAIEHRVQTSGAKIIVTDVANRSKLDEVETSARFVTLRSGSEIIPAQDLDFAAEMARRAPGLEPVLRSVDDPFLIMFTSGTTGPAKPLLVPLKAIVSFAAYMREAVGLRDEDKFWNIADPGWAYGLYYAITGPLALGHAILLYDGPFSAESTVKIIREYGITNLAGSPTAYRLLVAAGPDAVRAIKGQLRAVSSAGEALNPEVIRWFAEHLDTVILDHYGQTEVGMVLCNHHALAHPVQPGSAGFSMPGVRVVIVDDAGAELGVGAPGILAMDVKKSPLFWFTGYERMATPSLGERYYLSGDVAELNENGSISFVGRADDVITSSGYRIGPFDVESALMEHPAVIEAAVIGKPDPQRTEIVKAFVVLGGGRNGSPDLAEELRAYVKKRLSAHAYPREIDFVKSLPKTPSGKIQRFILRNQEKTNS
jgi:acetyl-CoA synthetase